MPARVIKLTNFKYQDILLDRLWVILDQNSSPPVLPLLYTTHLSRFGIVYNNKRMSKEDSQEDIDTLIPKAITDASLRAYVYCLAKFLSYLEFCEKEYDTPGMHCSTSCSEKFVNHYINNVLSQKLDSTQSLNTHRSALSSYFNWLSHMELCSNFDIRIYRKTRQQMHEKSTKQHYVQYITKYWRLELLKFCETLSEKLMMRMGYEVGLRTSELMGLRVSGKNSLKTLFDKINNEDYKHLNRFRYLLEGRYTKYSKSRWIYFDREILVDMKRYYDTERKWIIDQTKSKEASLFLRTDRRFIGTGIGEEQASRVFRKRANAAGLNQLFSFHDLRHTFATELFHSELASDSGRETRSESAALIVVAQRLGHSFGKDGNAPSVTTRYIRMRMQMIEMEDAEFETYQSI